MNSGLIGGQKHTTHGNLLHQHRRYSFIIQY